MRSMPQASARRHSHPPARSIGSSTAGAGGNEGRGGIIGAFASAEYPMDRRHWLRSAPLVAALPAVPLLAGCGARDRYEAEAAALWRHAAPLPPTSPATAPIAAPAAAPVADTVLRELVRYATLAANSHNTQPWRFERRADGLLLRPDATRRTPVVDPDDHHLWASLGCATENLVLAAAAFGLHAEPAVTPAGVQLTLTPSTAARSPLFEAIVDRQCTRSLYDGSAVSAADLRTLEAATVAPGLRLLLLTDRAQVDAVAEHVARATVAQMQDARFVTELKQWIRFSDAEALAARDGLAARASGNPALPRWLGSAAFGYAVTPESERDRYAAQVRSSSGVAVFVSERSDVAAFVAAGRAYQRFALQATALGLRNAFVNPPVEIAALRSQFGSWLDLGGARPNFIVRFGRAAALPRSLRRPVEAVMAA